MQFPNSTTARKFLGAMEETDLRWKELPSAAGRFDRDVLERKGEKKKWIPNFFCVLNQQLQITLLSMDTWHTPGPNLHGAGFL